MPGFMQYLFESLLKDRDVILFNNGKQKRDNVYVDDVVEANLKAMRLIRKTNFDIFNIGGGKPRTSLERARITRRILKSKSKIILNNKTNPFFDYDIYLDISKARKVLGYRPTELDQNITKMIKEGKVMQKQYKVALPYFSKKDISWIKEKVAVVLNGQLSTGRFVREFEESFARLVGTKYAVCVNTCTSALEISLKALGLKQDDEVIVPAETFIATGMAVTLNGGRVVFAEIDPKSFCITLDEIKRRISRRTKGIMLVHFAGNMSHDTLEIQRFCKAKGLF